MNSNNKARVINITIGVALIAGLAFLVMKTRAVDFDTHADVVNTLRQLKQVDAEWNVDVLKSKTGFNSNYDPVASPLPLIESLQRALANTSDQLWTQQATDQATLKPLLDQYSKSMNEKITLIERFKSQNSILRNSSRFLPVAAAELAESIRPVDPQLRAQIDATLNAILADTMTYNLAPDANLKAQIETNATALLDRTAPLATELRERAEVFSAHVNTILRQQAIGDEVLGTITALPTAKHIDALTDSYQGEHEKLLHDQQRYRQILIGYSIVLLALLAYLGWTLLRSYRLLNKTNQSLEHANHELKESQVYMVQAEKMSALGQMVAGIAHEINTPLAYVKGTLDVLRLQLSPVTDMSKGLSEFSLMARDPQHDRRQLNVKFAQISALSKEVEENRVMDEMGGLLKDGLHGIDQISEIVQNLKNFSRLDRAKISEFSVEDGLESTLLLANNLLKNKVRIEREFAHVPKIKCSPSQINQVFLNIITNAVHAMPDDRAEIGVITLSTALEDKDTIRVDIADNGTGIPAEVLPKIFDPFFTTKEIGKGTGMGLSISFKIIQEHGGKILVNTEPDIGTVFSILLPVAHLEETGVNSVLIDDEPVDEPLLNAA